MISARAVVWGRILTLHAFLSPAVVPAAALTRALRLGGPVAHAAAVIRLRELIAALDRRQAQPTRAEEAGIAKDAAEMRSRAVARLAALETEPLPRDS